MSSTPTSRLPTIPKAEPPKPKSRPSELNKLFTSLLFASFLAAGAYFVFAYSTTRSRFRAPALLTIGSFVLSFIFTTVFQVIKCPFDAATVSVASAGVSLFILFIISLLSFPWTGSFLLWIVSSAFPYVPDPKQPAQFTDQLIYYTDEEKHKFSRAYSYWMFWGGILPMYTILGFIRSC
jgi:hypothetical protein